MGMVDGQSYSVIASKLLNELVWNNHIFPASYGYMYIFPASYGSMKRRSIDQTADDNHGNSIPRYCTYNYIFELLICVGENWKALLFVHITIQYFELVC